MGALEGDEEGAGGEGEQVQDVARDPGERHGGCTAGDGGTVWRGVVRCGAAWCHLGRLGAVMGSVVRLAGHEAAM